MSVDLDNEEDLNGQTYTLDDIEIGESNTDDLDVYMDCCSTLPNHGRSGGSGGTTEAAVLVKEDPKTEAEADVLSSKAEPEEEKAEAGDGGTPKYFVLENVPMAKSASLSGSVSVNKLAQAFEVNPAWVKNPVDPGGVKNPVDPGGVKNPVDVAEPSTGCDDEFISVFQESLNPVEDPFKGFEEVAKSCPVYELAQLVGTNLKSGSKTEDPTITVEAKNTDEASERFIADPIYDCVPSRSSSERESSERDSIPRYSVLNDDPIYETLLSQRNPDLRGKGHTGAEGQGQRVKNVIKSLDGKLGLNTYEMAQPISGTTTSKHPELLTNAQPPRYMACKQGFGNPVNVQFLDKDLSVQKSLKNSQKDSEDSNYDRLKFRRLHSKKRKSRSTFYIGPLIDDIHEDASNEKPLNESTTHPDHVTGSTSSELFYESIVPGNVSDDGWGSSEFDSDDDMVLCEAPNKPLPPEPKQNKLSDNVIAGGAKLIGRINKKNNYIIDEDTRCLPVDLNLSKHLPPELPPPPDDLSDLQKKMRCVIELMISSEMSYINALERIIEGYEKVVLENVGSPRSEAHVVFKEAHQLLSHHRMFQIELSDRTRRWDQEEKIGDIFTASFSKSMLVDSYSKYVNSFAAAMEEIKAVARTKTQFSDFLKAKESSSPDRLSIFGLMVKPIQRFPQFIMVLQDLLKYTPQRHHDRGALQLALTELENVTHKLNERKRHSEQKFAAMQIMGQMSRQFSQIQYRATAEKTGRLIRQDDLEQVVGEAHSMKSKKVRIYLLDNYVLCVKVGIKDQGGHEMERYKLKWMFPIRDMETKDSAITPDMDSIDKGEPGKFSIYSNQIVKPEEDPFHLFADLNEMLHDYPVLNQISRLVASLKRSYMGLSEDIMHEHIRDLQRYIHMKDEQLRLVNSCTLILMNRSEKFRYVFQTPTAAVKHEWCMDFLIAKLATDKQNNPGWLAGSEESQELSPVFFMKSMSVDVPRHYTKMKCAVPVFLTSSSGSRLGIQHLWVITTTPTMGQVSIISIHNSKPSLTESFQASEVEVTCTVHVPGFALDIHEFAFPDDTVWLGTIDNEILIFPLTSSDGISRRATATFSLLAAPVLMKYVDERVFCSLVNGTLAVFSRNHNGVWNVTSPDIITLGRSVISCMKIIDDSLWVAMPSKILMMEIDTLKVQGSHNLDVEEEDLVVSDFVKSGVGIWVSFRESSKLRLYHLETKKNLQEINVASTVNRLVEEKKASIETMDSIRSYSGCTITTLTASKGLLWIGTNKGFVLTLALPRLRDGVPLISGRPKVSLHAHRGPVTFLIPIYYSSSVAELNRSSSKWYSMKRNRHSCGSIDGRENPAKSNENSDALQSEEKSDRRDSFGGEGDSKSDVSQLQTEVWKAEIRKSMEHIPEKDTSEDSHKAKKSSNLVSKSNSQQKLDAKVVGNKVTETVRRKKSLRGSDRPRLRSKTLSFRSELAHKIAKRNLASSDPELDDNEDEDEVRRLYENLLETDDDKEDTDEDNFSSSYEELPKDLGSPENALSARKDEQTIKWATETRVPGFERASSCKRRCATLGRGNSTKGTMSKKNPCNAVILVCGGDGYCDWNKTKQKPGEDASLLLWIYKL